METFIEIIRWLIAGLAAAVWLGFIFINALLVLRNRMDDFSSSLVYHLGVLAGIVAVVVAPIGSIMQRAPFAFLSLVPEVVYPLDILFGLLRRKR